jgi:hypothetical protein
MRWFKRSKPLKQKVIRPKRPKPKRGPAPKYKTMPHKQRAPKIDKPIVERPFAISPSSQKREANSQDVSVDEIQNVMAEGLVVSEVIWNLSSNPCPKCIRAKGDSVRWKADAGGEDALVKFMNNRPTDTSPTGKPIGLYAYSHPECACWLTLRMETGEERNVGPYAAKT